MKLKIVFPIIAFLALMHNTCGQALDSRFIVLLGHFNQPFLNDTVIHCAGTLISPQHILTTASCVIVESPTQIAVNVRSVTLVPEGGNFSASTLVPANRVFIHPFYENSQHTNNAAIVMTNIIADNPQLGFVARLLGRLTTSTTCNLFGWGGELLDPRRDAVLVNNFCDADFPQSFCTILDSFSHATCSALQGSPLTCGNDMEVAGFLTNVGGCGTNSGRPVLNYISVDDVHDWIEGIFGPQLPERDPVNFIVTVLEFTPPSGAGAIPRCFGTVITSNRILTTASCATIESPRELVVQTRIVQGSSSTSTSWRATRIYIYPLYRQENPFVNNVAIIEIGSSFDQRIVPRSLGNLQQNSACQLFGWGPTDIRFTRGDPITVNGPQFCDSDLPQAFCSNHPNIFHYSCNAMTGSPITCGGNESIVAGFLINNATCSSNGSRVSLSYHSVSQFTEWIQNPIDAPSGGTTAKISTVLFLFAVSLNVLQ